MVNNSLIQVDLLEMNVSWISEDLELYQNGISGFLMSLSFTLLRGFTFVMAVIVHRAFYRLMKRLPGRAVNQIIYPYMVSLFVSFNGEHGGEYPLGWDLAYILRPNRPHYHIWFPEVG